MSDQRGFQITPEEDRFLRTFFRRQAGRYLLGMGALAVLGVWGVAQRGGEAVAPDPAQQQELAALRAENEKLRTQLGELSQHVAKLAAAPDPAKPMGELAEGVAGALRRLDRVESRIEELPAGGTSGELADASGALERLSNLESRQQREEKSRETFEKSVLTRLYAVENGRDSFTEASTSTQQSILGRLDALERRADALERGRTTQAVPAAPEP
jgi:DNA repair exonuclease SbcCD ATPase subunit